MKHIIKTPVGNGLKSSEEDVVKIRKVLKELGYKDDNSDLKFMDRTLLDNIKKFQKDNDLKSDGLIFPEGPTETKLLKRMANSPVIRCLACGAPHGGVRGNLCPSCYDKQNT